MQAMFKFTVFLALSLAAFDAAATGSSGDDNLVACHAALLPQVRDPFATIHMTPSERLLSELENETITEPHAFVDNNPVHENIMLMSEYIGPLATTSSATETATSTSGAEQADLNIDEEEDAIEDEPGQAVEEASASSSQGSCSLKNKPRQHCEVFTCLRGTGKCYMGNDGKCHSSGLSGQTSSVACHACRCTKDR